MPTASESWRVVFRQGLVPVLSDKALAALRDGLANDDPALLQGQTTDPEPRSYVLDWPCYGGCAISFAGMRGEGLGTVGEVEEFFARACFEIDTRLGPASCRWFLNFWDETPRAEAVPVLLAEVELAIEKRKAVAS